MVRKPTSTTNQRGGPREVSTLIPRKDTNDPEKWADGCHLWCRNPYNTDPKDWRECEVLHGRRKLPPLGTVYAEGEVPPKGALEYYIHLVDYNRRMDTWVQADVLSDVCPDDPNRKMEFRQSTDTHEKERKRGEVVEFVEEEYGEGAAMDATSIRDHEEVTKIKNVSRIQLGKNNMEVWYFSPIPKEYTTTWAAYIAHQTQVVAAQQAAAQGGSASSANNLSLNTSSGGPGSDKAVVIDTLYFCEFSLDFFLHEHELARHYAHPGGCLSQRHPPGDEIYRDEESKLSMFEVDGARSKFYAQNLCYLAKFFLDHKTLHFDTDPFLFYVLCEFDERGYHLVGYFSKEKLSDEGFNLACILTLPAYQKRGFGTFLISFSYEISKKEEKVGSPEKPLSDLGQISYRSYWSRVIVEELQRLLKEGAKTVSIMEITLRTAIRTDDVIQTLAHLGLLVETPENLLEGEEEQQQGNGGAKIAHSTAEILVDSQLFERALSKLGKQYVKVKPELLHWAPLRVDVKRDKWSMRSKARRLTGASGGAFPNSLPIVSASPPPM